MEYQALTQNQTSAGGWAKIMTLYQNYMSSTDWNENNITFRVFQCGGEGYAEGTFYLSTFKGSRSSNKIIFLNLKELFPNRVSCMYINHDNMIDVYVKGPYTGYPIKLIVLQAPVIGKIQLWDRIGFISDPVGTQVFPTDRDAIASVGITWNGTTFKSSTYSDVAGESYITRLFFHLRTVRGITLKTFTGSGKIATIEANRVPSWAYYNDKTETTFMQDYCYTKDEVKSWGKFRFTIASNGDITVSDLPSLADGGYLQLFIDLIYRRE